MSNTSNFPPFPPLTWDTAWWRTEIRLPGLSPNHPINFLVQVNWTPDQKDARSARPPTAPQAEAYKYLQESGERIRETILTAIQPFVPEWEGKALEEFASEIELTTVILLHTALDGIAYMGYEWCGMEFEHGIGVIAHQDRAVYVGMAEEAREERLAMRDVRRARKTKILIG